MTADLVRNKKEVRMSPSRSLEYEIDLERGDDVTSFEYKNITNPVFLLKVRHARISCVCKCTILLPPQQGVL